MRPTMQLEKVVARARHTGCLRSAQSALWALSAPPSSRPTCPFLRPYLELCSLHESLPLAKTWCDLIFCCTLLCFIPIPQTLICSIVSPSVNSVCTDIATQNMGTGYARLL